MKPGLVNPFKLVAGFVPSGGSYVCRFEPLTDESGFIAGDVELLVRSGLTFSSHNPNIHGDVITLPFVPALKVFTFVFLTIELTC